MAKDVSVVIVAKLKCGTLPQPADGKSYAGKGTDNPCDGCDESVTPEQVEFEIDVSQGQTLRFHQECFDAWRAART
jgi:hypothetical protein